MQAPDTYSLYIRSLVFTAAHLEIIFSLSLVRFIRSPKTSMCHKISLDITMLSDNIMDYFFVAQGKTTIPGVDDAEELTLTDVRLSSNVFSPSI